MINKSTIEVDAAQLRRAVDEQSPHDAAHQCDFKGGRKPRAHDGDLLHPLQFRAHPSNFEDHASDGRWRHVEAVGNGRHGEGVGGLRVCQLGQTERGRE